MEDNDFRKYLKEVEPRIDKLFKIGSYLEAFLLVCAVLENELIDTINLYDRYVESLLSIENFKFGISDFRKKKYPRGMTLGQLKDHLSIYCNNLEIKKDLNFFIDLRNKCVHKIFEEDLSGLESKIIKNYSRFYKLLCDLVEMKTIILKEQIKKKRGNDN